MTPDECADYAQHLRNAFPNFTDTQMFELVRLALEKKLSANQFKDAIDNAIMSNHFANCLTVADILDNDPKVRLYSHREIYNECKCYGTEKDKAEFPRVGIINGIVMSVRATEIESLPKQQRKRFYEKLEKYSQKQKKDEAAK